MGKNLLSAIIRIIKTICEFYKFFHFNYNSFNKRISKFAANHIAKTSLIRSKTTNMSHKKLKIFIKNTSIVAAIAAFALLFSACETKIYFLTSAVVPAAKGYVTVETDNNKNYKIQISILNLAESKRLTPPKDTYVVWIVGANNNAQNIGQIHSSGMNATLKTVSSFNPHKIFITAEDEGSVQYPSQIILTTSNF